MGPMGGRQGLHRLEILTSRENAGGRRAAGRHPGGGAVGSVETGVVAGFVTLAGLRLVAATAAAAQGVLLALLLALFLAHVAAGLTALVAAHVAVFLLLLLGRALALPLLLLIGVLTGLLLGHEALLDRRAVSHEPRAARPVPSARRCRRGIALAPCW